MYIVLDKKDAHKAALQLVQHDRRTLNLGFSVPRHADGVDLMGLTWVLRVERPDGETDAVYLGQAMPVENDGLVLDWTVGPFISEVPGLVRIQAEGLRIEANEETKAWQSGVMYISVGKQVEVDTGEHTEEITELERLIATVGQTVEPLVEEVQEKIQTVDELVSSVTEDAENLRQMNAEITDAENGRVAAEELRAEMDTERAEIARRAEEASAAAETAAENANTKADMADEAAARANEAAEAAEQNVADVAEVKESNARLREGLAQLEQTVDGKQDALVSGTNLKTVNGQSLLGGGNITIQGGGGSYDDSEIRAELEEHDERITALEKVWEVYADNADGNKTVPTGSVQASVQMIGGKSEVIGNEIVNADVESVTCDDVVRVIPSAVRALDGYGWSAGGVYNEVDFENKKFIRRVGRVDLGTVVFSKYTVTGGDLFRTVNISNIKHTNLKRNILVPGFDATTSGGRHPGTVSGDDNRVDFMVDSGTYENATEFMAAMNGVVCHYELDEPIITDITDLMGDTLNWLTVDDGDTITFVNSAGLEVPNVVQYRVKPRQTDVQINGTSIVENGVANIPYATNGTYGITKPYGNGNYGIGADTNGGGLYVFKASESHIRTRSHQYAPIVPTNLNFAVKAAFTDSNRMVLTDEEKATAREVLGVSGDKPWKLKATISTASSISLTSVDFSGCTEFMIFGKYTGTGSASVFSAGLNGETTISKTKAMLTFPSVNTAMYATVYAHFKDTCNGIECVAYGNKTNTTNVLSNSVSIPSGSTVYHNFDCSVSEITGLLFPNADSPSIKIYAR